MASIIIAFGIGSLFGCVVLLAIGAIIYIHGRKSEDASLVTYGAALLYVTSIIARFGIVVLTLGAILFVMQNDVKHRCLCQACENSITSASAGLDH